MSDRVLLSRRGLLAATGGSLVTACTPALQRAARHRRTTLAPVHPIRVDPSRLTRVMVGLRPFRPAGYVVDRQTLGTKQLIHNYGHGGAGITLSWGTAHQAISLAPPVNGISCAVLGCGAVGLATARLLQRRGANVTIHASAVPPETTSNVAGGHWWPFGLFDTEVTTPAFMTGFHLATRIAYREFRKLLGTRYGVSWRRNYSLSREHQPFSPFTESLRDIAPEMALLGPGQHPFGASSVQQYDTMLIEPARYLPALMDDFRGAGGRVTIREFGSPAQLLELEEPLIFNCTGLGARALFGDGDITPARGQLVVMRPQPEIDHNLFGDGAHAFSREDGLLLGGTFQRGNWNLEVDPADTESILERAGRLARHHAGRQVEVG